MKIVVTGGANGIGRATAEKLGSHGHEVTVVDIDEEALEDLKDGIEHIRADVRNQEEVRTVFQDRELDVLVNSAGFQEQGSVEDMPQETFRKHIETNYIGTVNTVKAAIPALKDSEGRIVNISSLASEVTMPYLGAYSASKAAVNRFTDSLRMELEDFEVDVIRVEPGPVETGFNQEGIEALEKHLPETEYQESYRKRLEKGMKGVEPEKAAEKVVKAVESSRPKPRYRITWEAFLAPKLKLLLPSYLWDKLVKKIM